jgi:HAE1 family hydrophobic/amphiphilic exporter-1
MTSLSTAVGAVPAMISSGPGFETRAPMAMAVFGGVIISTLLTLYIVPAGYSLSENFLAKIKKA